MKETDYILASDLRTIRIVMRVLLDLIPENNPAIDADELRQVRMCLRRWEENLEKKVIR